MTHHNTICIEEGISAGFEAVRNVFAENFSRRREDATGYEIQILLGSITHYYSVKELLTG